MEEWSLLDAAQPKSKNLSGGIGRQEKEKALVGSR